MSDSTVLGMSLDVGDDDPIASIQPLDGMVVVKGLDPDGDVVYCTAATKGLQSVECLGMAEYAVLRLKRGIASRLDGEGPL
jgi:hypothetical protein